MEDLTKQIKELLTLLQDDASRLLTIIIFVVPISWNFNRFLRRLIDRFVPEEPAEREATQIAFDLLKNQDFDTETLLRLIVEQRVQEELAKTKPPAEPAVPLPQ